MKKFLDACKSLASVLVFIILWSIAGVVPQICSLLVVAPIVWVLDQVFPGANKDKEKAVEDIYE